MPRVATVHPAGRVILWHLVSAMCVLVTFASLDSTSLLNPAHYLIRCRKNGEVDVCEKAKQWEDLRYSPKFKDERLRCLRLAQPPALYELCN